MLLLIRWGRNFSLVVLLGSWCGSVVMRAAVAPSGSSAVPLPSAPRKYVITSEEITNAAFKLVHDAGLSESLVDELVVAALAAAAIDRVATNKYYLRVIEVVLPDGQKRLCQRRSFLYNDQRYYYDREHVDIADWYAADVATQVLTARIAALSAERAARGIESVIVRRDTGSDASGGADNPVVRLACKHHFHQGCFLTNNAYHGAAGTKPSCPVGRTEVDLAAVETLAAVVLPRGESAPDCPICLGALPSRQSRFGERFSRAATATKRSYAEAAGTIPVRGRSWADVVRGRGDAR